MNTTIFSDLKIEGMTEAKFNAQIARRRIERQLHYLPIAARFNEEREKLYQERARLTRIIESK